MPTLLLLCCLSLLAASEASPFTLTRPATNPIITPDSHPDIGTNINGPSVIKVPEWVSNPLGAYYLYFAHHGGQWIRLAVADHPQGPWSVVDDQPLHLDDASAWGGYGHIASPEVIIDDANQRLVMFFHAPHATWLDDHETTTPYLRTINKQATGMATSSNGLSFTVVDGPVISFPYLRTFEFLGTLYGISTRSLLFQAPSPGFPDGSAGWIERENPLGLTSSYRHCAVHRRGDRLWYFYSEKGDAPERIKAHVFDLDTDWQTWSVGEPLEVIRPEYPWEGSDYPIEPSSGGAVNEPVNQLRDPYYFADPADPDHGWLYYSIAGESGIGVAEVHWQNEAQHQLYLQAQATSHEQITVLWHTIPGASRYLLQRRETEHRNQIMAIMLPADRTRHDDRSLQPETSYQYSMQAFNEQ